MNQNIENTNEVETLNIRLQKRKELLTSLSSEMKDSFATTIIFPSSFIVAVGTGYANATLRKIIKSKSASSRKKKKLNKAFFLRFLKCNKASPSL